MKWLLLAWIATFKLHAVSIILAMTKTGYVSPYEARPSVIG